MTVCRITHSPFLISTQFFYSSTLNSEEDTRERHLSMGKKLQRSIRSVLVREKTLNITPRKTRTWKPSPDAASGPKSNLQLLSQYEEGQDNSSLKEAPDAASLKNGGDGGKSGRTFKAKLRDKRRSLKL